MIGLLIPRRIDLPTDATFNVVYFSRTVDAFSPEPIDATPANRQ